MPATCQHCGLDSEDLRVCEWCGKPIAPPPPRPPDPVSDDDDSSVFDGDDMLRNIDPFPVRLEWFLATALPLLAVVMALARVAGVPLVVLVAVACFGTCFCLSLYQIVDSIDEQWAPVGMAVTLSLVFGPLFVAAVFLAAWIITARDDCWTVVGLLVTHALTALAIAYALTPELSVAADSAGWKASAAMIDLTVIASASGWALANFWRPLNE